jgi:hypothetical protein
VDKPLKYDIALVFTAFQRNCVYVSIVKELSKKYKIAIFPVARDPSTISRIGNTNQQFLDLCCSLGADIISDDLVSAKIEILAQSNYLEADIRRINKVIKAERTFWMSGVAMGNSNYTNLFGKKIDMILVPDYRLYQYRIDHYRDDGIVFPKSMIKEIGIPYKKYPVFGEKLRIDYLLAHPTPYSFRNAQDRLDYLKNVYRLIVPIHKRGLIVAFKPHNADERGDYIVSARLLRLVSNFRSRPVQEIVDKIVTFFSRVVPNGAVRDFFVNFKIAIVYRRIMMMVVSLGELTPFSGLNLELFLPDIREGLITGRSNSIWHALFLEKPVWNCVDKSKPYFNDAKMHRFTMEYLNVHNNHRGCYFDTSLCDIISDSTRSADLIKFLGNELSQLHQRTK